jgi:hypothetical protein
LLKTELAGPENSGVRNETHLASDRWHFFSVFSVV